jgi:hypothetical protein
MRSEVEEAGSDRTSSVKVTIEVNCHGGGTTSHTEEYTGVHYLQVHEHMSYCISDCVRSVFGQYGSEEARLVFGFLKRNKQVKKSVVVYEGEEVPEGAMVVSHAGELMNSEDGIY